MSSMTPQQGLSLIEQARDRIISKPSKYEFVDWRRCVCGNFYRAASGRIARNQMTVVNPRPSRYYELMLLIKPVIENLADADLESVDEVIIAVSNHHAGTHYSATVKLERLIEAYRRHYQLPELMDIGKTERVITVVPAESPVPERETEREQIPSREPAQAPERTPERVPARD